MLWARVYLGQLKISEKNDFPIICESSEHLLFLPVVYVNLCATASILNQEFDADSEMLVRSLYITICMSTCQVNLLDRELASADSEKYPWDDGMFVYQVRLPDQKAGADSKMPEALLAGLHGGTAGLHPRPPSCPDPASCLLAPHAAPGQR